MASNKQIIEFKSKGAERLKNQYKGLERSTRRLEGSTRGGSAALGGMVTKLGLTTVALYAVARAITSVVKVGAGFEKTMSNLAAISGATGSELKDLERNAKALGATTVFTATQVGELQTEFAKLGFTSKEIQGVTKDTLALAAASGSDLATAAAVAGQTLRAFGMDVSETSRVTDTMAASFSGSALDMEKFTNSMQYVAPVAKAVGFSVEGTTAILGGLANAGISGSMAGTALRTVFLKLADSNSDLSKKLGGSVTSADKLLPALRKLSNSGVDLTEILGLVDKRAVSAFKVLLDGSDDVATLKDALDNSAGAAQEMADIQLDNLEGKTTLLGSAMEGLGIALFETVEGPLNSMVESVTSLTQGMTTLITQGVDGLATQVEELNDPLSKSLISATNLRAEFNRLTTSLLYLTKQESLSTFQTERRKTVIEELQKKYGNYFKNIDLESQGYFEVAKSISQARGALEDYIKSMIASATAKQFTESIASITKEMSEAQQQIDLMNESASTGMLAFIVTGTEYGILGSEIGKTHMSGADAVKKLDERIEVLNKRLLEQMELMAKATEEAQFYSSAIEPTTLVEPKKVGGEGGKGGEDPAEDITKAQLARLQQFYNERAVLFGEDTQRQLDLLVEQGNAMVELYEQQGLDVNEVVDFYTEKKRKILEKDAQMTLAIYSRMATNFSSFLGEFAGMQKAAARLQQVAALIDAYSTANALMADKKLIAAFPMNLIAAAAALATGIANAMQISKSIGEFKSAATGFDGIVDRPTVFMTGEGNKREHVSVTPLESPNVNGPRGDGGITLNISAPLLDETVVDSIIPAIQRAQRMNLA